MVSITIPMEESFKAELDSFPWVNWSEVARENALKEDIFNRYIKTGEVTDEDWEFCESIDWHPVDELPMKEEFLKELEQRKKGPFKTAKQLEFWKE